MDFGRVLPELSRALDAAGIRYALMGGFALGFHGAARMTSAIDLLVARDDLPGLDAVLGARGCQLRARTDNVSHFTAPLRAQGSVDGLHAFRPHSLGMLKRARRLPYSGGDTPVLLPEDIIGLKLQAIANDPGRREQDLADVQRLTAATGAAMDWGLLQDYFLLFGMQDEWRALHARHHAAE